MSILFIFMENIVAELLDSSNSWEVQAVSNLLQVYFITGFLPINSNEECLRVFLFFEYKGRLGVLGMVRLSHLQFNMSCFALDLLPFTPKIGFATFTKFSSSLAFLYSSGDYFKSFLNTFPLLPLSHL